MAIDEKIRVEKLQYNVNRLTAKISALASGKKYNTQYLIGEKKTLPVNLNRLTKKAKFTFEDVL